MINCYIKLNYSILKENHNVKRLNDIKVINNKVM